MTLHCEHGCAYCVAVSDRFTRPRVGDTWKHGGDTLTIEDEVAIAQPLPRRARPWFEHESEEEYLAAIESTRVLTNPFAEQPAHVLALEEEPHFGVLRMKP